MMSIIKAYKDEFILYNTYERKYKKLTQTDCDIIKYGDLKELDNNSSCKKIKIESPFKKSINLKDTDYIFIELKTPLKVFWDITEACNAQCIHCFTNSGKRADSELTTKQVLEIIDQLVDGGAMSIAFSGGEPFIRSDMIYILEYATQKNISISLTTNGTLLDEEKIKTLLRLKIKSITFSLDGFSEETFGKIRKGIDIATVLKNIRLMSQYSNNKDTKVNVRTTLNSLNFQEVFDILRFCSDVGVTCFKVNNTNLWGRAKKKPFLKLDEHQFINVLLSLQEKSQEYKCRIELPIEKYLLNDLEEEHLGRCTSTIDTINIFANGDVAPCGFCERKLILGNVIRDGFRNIILNSLPFDFDNMICKQCAINKLKGIEKMTSAMSFIK